jgi:hypothetical protein
MSACRGARDEPRIDVRCPPMLTPMGHSNFKAEGPVLSVLRKGLNGGSWADSVEKLGLAVTVRC